MRDDEDRPAKPTVHQVGELLDFLSVDELDARIVLLRAEISRLEQAREHRQRARDAAASVFAQP